MRRTVVALLAVIILAGCVHGSLDRSVSHGARTHVALDDVPVKGFPVDVDLYDGDGVRGELLAADDAGLSVLTKTGTRRIAKSNVRKVSVEIYGSHAWEIVGWTVVGAVSTLSHGFLLIVTAPTWLVVGLTTAAGNAISNDLSVDARHAMYLWQFARFPEGLPPGWRDAAPPLPMQPDAPAMEAPAP